MSAKAFASCIGAAIGGMVVGTVLFFVINQFVVINGAGLLKRQGWPWSEFYLWGLAGALLGAAGSLLTWRRRRVHGLEIEEAAQLMGLDHRPNVSRTDLADAGRLNLFTKWHHTAHFLTGKRDGIPVQMLDYTYVEKGDESSSFYSQTVVLLPGASHWPAFELRPRHLGIRMLGLLGVQGIAFDPDHAGPDAAPVIEQFNQHYHLSLAGLDNELAKLGQQVEDLPVPDATTAGEEVVRRLFVLGVLQFFAEHPGWYVECNGQHLALWRRKTIVRGVDRPQFLAEALEIRRALVEAHGRMRPTVVAARPPVADPLLIPARLAGTILGVFLGFFGGGIVFARFFFFDDPFGLGGWRTLLFLGIMLPSPLLGGLLGNLLLTRPMYRWLSRRRDRERQAVAASPWRQPPGSTAQIQQEGDALRIVLPARGLWRGLGGFGLVWCILWNVFILVFSVFWMPAALRGEVKWEGGNDVVHPVVAVLVLVPFWAVGLGFLTALLYRARRRGLVLVDRGRLEVEEAALFGVKRREWLRQDLAGVQAVPRGQGPYPRQADLCLTPRHGELVRLLSWRDRKELHWLAGLIREKWQMA